MRNSCLEINGWAGECRDNFNLIGNNNNITLNNSLLYVFNITGQIVLTSVVTNQEKLNLDLTSGIYLIKVENNFESQLKKIVIK